MKNIILLAASVVFTFNLYAQENAQTAAAEAAQAIANAPEVKEPAPKPNYWSHSLMTNLNFLQSSYANWAKGGFNNIAMNAYIDGNSNYKKENLSWNNRLQLDYGFLYSEDKPIYQKTKDRMLFESTFGYKAAKSLNYSAKFTFLNQFTNGYTYPVPSVPAGTEPTTEQWKEARVLKSGFFSPAVINLGFGIDWVPTQWLSINFAPLTGGFTIVATEVLRKGYGMKRKKEFSDITTYPDQKDSKGFLKNGNQYKSSRFEFGAQLTIDAKIKINDNFEGSTHLILFSDYLNKPQNLRVNWDNRLMWKVAKYFSLNLTTNLIYDETILIVQNKDKDKYPDGRQRVQFSEALQFGFTYTFATK